MEKKITPSDLKREAPMSDLEPLEVLRLSIQRALLDEVTDRLVAVTCGLVGRHIKITAYFSGIVIMEDVQRMQFVGGEVIADFPEGYTIEESCLSINEHNEEMLDFWAFRRAHSV